MADSPSTSVTVLTASSAEENAVKKSLVDKEDVDEGTVQ